MDLGAKMADAAQAEMGLTQDIHGLIRQLANARQTKLIYDEMMVPVPDNLRDHIAMCEKNIRSLRRDALEARRKQLQQKQEQLKTQEEKRKDVADELASLEAELAK